MFYTSLLAALVGFGTFFDHVAAVGPPPGIAVAAVQSDLAREQASPEVERVAIWVLESQDHSGLPFIVVDKARARLFAFDASARLLASAPVLLGASRGDGPAAEAATRAARFVAAGAPEGDGMTWTNADASLSLHAIPSAMSPPRGAQRLSSRPMERKRISAGSLHVATDFYSSYLRPLRGQASIAYVVPEGVPVREVFDWYGTGSGLSLAQFPRSSSAARRPS